MAWNSLAEVALLPFRRSRSVVGPNRAPADAWSSSNPGVWAHLPGAPPFMRKRPGSRGLDDEFTRSSIGAVAGADTYGLGPAESRLVRPRSRRPATSAAGVLDVDLARTLAVRG
jgi:hypothetical protein